MRPLHVPAVPHIGVDEVFYQVVPLPIQAPLDERCQCFPFWERRARLPSPSSSISREP
jgi:hypothetical protein